MKNNIPQTIKSPRDGEEMKLVWHDEFDGDKLDGDKWILFDRMYGDKNVIRSYERERNVKVENGMLVMRSWKEDDGIFSTHKTVTSTGQMSFLYGYAEIRARFPFVRGSFPSFWLQSAPQHRTTCYMTEVDVIEPYFYGYLESGLHRWFLNESPIGFGSAYADEWYHPERYTIPGFEEYWTFWNYDKLPELTEAQKAAIEKFNSEFHTYGFGWSKDEMYITMDGAIVGKFDLTTLTPGGRNNRIADPEDPRVKVVESVTEGADGFRYDAMFINFTNWVGSNFRYKGYGDPVDESFPHTFEVDYIRLYQKPGEGKLFDDHGNGLTQEQATNYRNTESERMKKK